MHGSFAEGGDLIVPPADGSQDSSLSVEAYENRGSEEEKRKKPGLFPNSPRTPPVWSFLREKKIYPIFLLKIPSLILRLVPLQLESFFYSTIGSE